jgi:serine protease AprX
VRVFSVPAILTVSLGLAVGQETPSKIGPELLEQAKTKTVVPAFVVLTDQPQREVMERTRGVFERRVQNAEANYGLIAAQTAAPEWLLTEAQDSLDAVILETRQAAFREIEPHIRFQQDRVAAHLAGVGATVIYRYTGVNMLGVLIPKTALQAIATNDEVARVALASDLRPHLNIAVPALGAPAFWTAGFTGTGRSVAILDTGIRTSHPALAGKNVISQVFLDSGRLSSCFLDSTSSADDSDGHGTFVAGIIASIGPSGYESYQGVAKGIGRIYNLKVAYRKQSTYACQNQGSAAALDVLYALDWTVKNTAVSALNFSYGSAVQGDDDLLAQMVDDYVDRFGLSFVTTAGNDGPNPRTLSSPGIGYNVISIGAMDDRGTVERSDDQVASLSSRGPTVGGRYKPDIAAPGVNINSADAQSGQFSRHSGTSAAAPFIAGSLPLLSQAGTINPLAAKALLLNTTDTPGWTSDIGWGYANLTRLQRSRNSFSGTVAAPTRAGNYVFYVGNAAGAFRATLTSNRHIAYTNPPSSVLNPIGLYLYNRSTGEMLAKSERWADNVQQISATASAGVVVKVKSSPAAAAWTSTSGQFGVALSEPGFTSAKGPSLRITCAPPATTSPKTSVAIKCSANNAGDLDVYSVGASFSGPASIPSLQFGTLAPNATSSQTAALISPGSPGTYSFQASLTGSAYGESFFASSNFNVTVSENIPLTPVISPNGVVNAAGFQAGIAPNSWFTIRGANLAAVTDTWDKAIVNGTLPTALDGVSVSIGGKPAYIAYVSPGQINGIVPEVGTGTMAVTVTNSVGTSAPASVTSQSASPAFFLWDKYAVATHQDYSWAAKDGSFQGVTTVPVKPGEVIILWGTGFGPTDPAAPVGVQIPSDQTYSATGSVSVTVGGIPAQVYGTALAPGFAGLYQVAIQVPPSAVDGDLPVVASVSGAQSPGGVFITVSAHGNVVAGPAPTIAGYVWATAPLPNQPFSGTITGTGFEAGMAVWFCPSAGSCQQLPPSQLTVNSATSVNVTNVTLAAGSWQIYVQTAGGPSGRSAPFLVQAPVKPTITSYTWTTTPKPNQPFSGTITGTGFVSPIAVWLCPSGGTCQQLAASQVKLNGPTSVSVTNVTLAAGSWQIYVQTVGGPSDRSVTFSVREGLTISGVSVSMSSAGVLAVSLSFSGAAGRITWSSTACPSGVFLGCARILFEPDAGTGFNVLGPFLNLPGADSGVISSGNLTQPKSTVLGPTNVKVTLIDNAGNRSNTVVVAVDHWVLWTFRSRATAIPAT